MYADQLESPLIEYHVFQQFFRHLHLRGRV
jgi:hypothetical protein